MRQNKLIDKTARNIIKQKGRSFYFASLFLTKECAKRAYRLYEFCRRVDDMVDEAKNQNEAKFNIHELHSKILSTKNIEGMNSDANFLFKEMKIDKEVVRELIKGMAQDVYEVRVKSVDELLRYCYRAAGTVGIMMCKVLEVKDPSAYHFAIDLGIAMQLTNICRDIKEDAIRGRVYLPASMIGEIQPKDLICPPRIHQKNIYKSVDTLLDIAEKYYQSGRSGLVFLKLRAKVSIFIASILYERIGIDLKARKYMYWKEKVVVSVHKKILLSLFALPTAIISKSCKQAVPHNPLLHRPLEGLPYSHAS